MKKNILLLLLCVSFASVYFPQSLNGRFSSSLYTFERFDTAGSSETYLRAFQMLNLNIGKDNVWLRTNLNDEASLTKDLKKDPRLRVYHLYVDVRDLWDAVFFKIGRQPLFNSVAGGVFDGGTVGFKYSGYKFQVYYGGNVPAYQKFEVTNDWKDDYILGGEFTVFAINDWQFAAKYINKNFRSQSYTAQRLDENYNPINILIENKSNQYEFLSGEISYDKENFLNVNARYDYDLNFMSTSRVELYSRYVQIEDVGLSLYYNFREPKIRYNSIFSVFDYGNTWEIEAGADYRIENKFTVLGKVANVTYKDETSQRLTLGFSTPWGTITGRKNLGYAGEMDAVSLYSAYSFIDGLLTPSVGLSFTTYKLSDNDERNELVTILAGTNLRPWRTLSFDLQGQYLNNKIYSNDWRLFFKLNYWFNFIFD